MGDIKKLDVAGFLTRVNFTTGKTELSGFGREYTY